MFSHLERMAIQLIKDKFSIHTRIVDSDSELSLYVYSKYDDSIVHSHKQDLLPLLESFRKRLDK